MTRFLFERLFDVSTLNSGMTGAFAQLPRLIPVTCCDEVKPRHCAGLFRQTLQLRLYGPAPVLGVCFSKVHRRRSDRQIDKPARKPDAGAVD